MCKVQTKSVAELQVKSRPCGSPFIVITVLAFSFQGLSMSSLKRSINLKVTGSAFVGREYIYDLLGKVKLLGKILVLLYSNSNEITN